MKTSTIKKAVKKSESKSKKYSTSQIREAIAYWKGRLASLNEDEEEHGDNDDDDDDDDGKGGGDSLGFASEDSAESKAEGKPVGVFNPMRRFYRMHVHAETVVKEKLGKLLSKSKFGNPDSVDVDNSGIDGESFKMPDDKLTVTVRVKVDQAQVKGFRKFIAVLKEEDIQNPDNIDEGLLSAFFKGVADTAKGVSKEAKAKIDDANEKLKVRIGVTAMQEYFQAFFGKPLAKKINTNNVFCGVDESGNEAEFIYCASVTIKQ